MIPAPDGFQYGIRFHDGSVRDCWNGRTQLQRATEDLARLRAEYPRDNIVLVRRAGPDSPWIPLTTDPERVVARMRYPMGVTGIDQLMRGLAKVYRDKNLVIITDGPLFEQGWMVVAHADPEPPEPA